jgi:hypothetical protein
MPEESARATDPAAAAFAEHVRAFHRSLPPDEQALLEEVFRLAALAEAAEGGDVQGHQLGQRGTDFFHGLITEVGFPAADAASKDAAKLAIKLSPENPRQ